LKILKVISILSKPRRNKSYNGSKDAYYKTKGLKQLRAYKLQLNPICEDCLELENRVTEGQTVDHIQPRKQGGKDIVTNLRTRCKRHNAIKTALDNENNGFYK